MIVKSDILIYNKAAIFRKAKKKKGKEKYLIKWSIRITNDNKLYN